MEFSRSIVYKVEFKDMTPKSLPENLHSEVVLLDRSQDPLQPVLYQLCKDINEIKASHTIQLDKDAFSPLGLVLSIDRTRKQIILENGTTVTYMYMIVATGPRHLPPSSAAGFKTLLEALRMRQKMPNPVNNSQDKKASKSSEKNNRAFSPTTSSQPGINSIASDSFYSEELTPNRELTSQHKNLFEFQM